MQELVLFFKIVYKEVVDGRRHRTGEGVGDVNHCVIQRLASAAWHVRCYGNRTRSRSHKLLHVDVKESVNCELDDLPRGSKTEGDQDQKDRQDPSIEVDRLVVLHQGEA